MSLPGPFPLFFTVDVTSPAFLLPYDTIPASSQVEPFKAKDGED